VHARPDHSSGRLKTHSLRMQRKKFAFDLLRISSTHTTTHTRNMSTNTTTKKRKSAINSSIVTKKAKVSHSAAQPAALKSALKKSTEKTAAEPPVVTTLDDTDGKTNLTEDQTAALLAGFSSSDDEAASDGEEEVGVAIEKLPQAPRVKDIQKSIQKSTTSDPEKTPGVIYLGRIPHGFYEPQMRAYFSQFGDILHLRLARNRKTGRSRHYAFIEFASRAVAEIVAKTMDKYLLFGHILQVRTVPPEQVKEGMWKTKGREGKRPPPRNRMEGNWLKKGMTREGWEKRIEREAKKREEKREKLKEMGYEFDMPALKSVASVPVWTEMVGENENAVEVEEALKVLDEAAPVPVVGIEEEVTVISAPSDSPAGAQAKSTKKRQSSKANEKAKKKAKTLKI